MLILLDLSVALGWISLVERADGVERSA